PHDDLAWWHYPVVPTAPKSSVLADGCLRDDLRGAVLGGVGLPVGVLFLSSTFGLDALPVVLDLAFDLLLRPAQRLGHQLRRLLSRRDPPIPRLEGDTSTACE